MNWTKLALGTVVGGILSFLLGWLIWGMLLQNAMVWPEGMRELVEYKPEEMKMSYMVVSCLLTGLLITWLWMKMGISTFQSGAINGFIFGLLFSLCVDTSMIAMLKFANLNNAIYNGLGSAVSTLIVGGIIAWLLGRK